MGSLLPLFNFYSTESIYSVCVSLPVSPACLIPWILELTEDSSSFQEREGSCVTAAEWLVFSEPLGLAHCTGDFQQV